MNLNERIEALHLLGEKLLLESELESIIREASLANIWFTSENINTALQTIIDQYLQKDKLLHWTRNYSTILQKNIGIIGAGNIPLVVFHDVLASFILGHKSKIKLAQKDNILFPFLLKILTKIDPRTASYFEIVDRIKDIDAIIATGSDNTARYFHYYFDKYPHIIRKNRVGLAILDGNETDDQILALGQDVFQYFGLGCRNVSALRIPVGFDIPRLMRLWDSFKELRDNHAYNNNFDYNFAIYLMNKETYYVNDVFLLKEDAALISRLASVHFKYYNDIQEVVAELTEMKNQIQVVVSCMDIPGIPTLMPGQAQCPELNDYADGIDTLDFLANL